MSLAGKVFFHREVGERNAATDRVLFPNDPSTRSSEERAGELKKRCGGGVITIRKVANGYFHQLDNPEVNAGNGGFLLHCNANYAR
ncbi:MAG: hypothetical protein K9G33_15280 [Sneathiella sp.]|nr:hypothetical protein [Sneathiella sp.]